jgi:hypothetical protein
MRPLQGRPVNAVLPGTLSPAIKPIPFGNQVPITCRANSQNLEGDEHASFRPFGE